VGSTGSAAVISSRVVVTSPAGSHRSSTSARDPCRQRNGRAAGDVERQLTRRDGGRRPVGDDQDPLDLDSSIHRSCRRASRRRDARSVVSTDAARAEHAED
jgi:hypothetical protein